MMLSANATGTAPAPLPASLIDDLAAEIAEHGYRVERHVAGLSLTLPIGRIEAELCGSAFEVRIGAGQVVQVHEIREAFLHFLDHAAPGMAGRMAWRGDLPEGDLPPNFRVATIVAKRPVSPHFLRLTLAADDVSDFVGGGMHFRLTIPPKGRPPVWPRLDSAGRTVWPKEPDVLHRPAYTVVDVDPAQGRLSFDLFLHEGGLATQWAREVETNAVVGVVGPGGGMPPPGDFLLLAGDETALPAIRRILELSKPDRRGHVFIELGDPADRVALPMPSGMTVEWLTRGRGPSLLETVIAAPFPPAGASRFVWIAAERQLIRSARQHFRETLNVPLDEGYLSAYWTA
ncbi:siderophore-interacting protein [Jiella sp. MQZ9-1]|nr:siderophore-interacting protein [Jiella flava]